jgi:hypothetical protein
MGQQVNEEDEPDAQDKIVQILQSRKRIGVRITWHFGTKLIYIRKVWSKDAEKWGETFSIL